jgi:hypothetical protein
MSERNATETIDEPHQCVFVELFDHVHHGRLPLSYHLRRTARISLSLLSDPSTSALLKNRPLFRSSIIS